MNNCRIQHSYGDDCEDLIEEEAVLLTESALNDGSATGVVLQDTVPPAPNGAVVEVGGKSANGAEVPPTPERPIRTTHRIQGHKAFL